MSKTSNVCGGTDTVAMPAFPQVRETVLCADCGDECKGEGIATGYAETRVPRFVEKRNRILLGNESQGTVPHSDETVKTEGGPFRYFPAVYDVEKEHEASDAEREAMPRRRICYACSAILERETMIATGRTCLYLVTVEDPAGTYLKVPMGQRHDVNAKGFRYRYKIANWPGSAEFVFYGRVRESKGYGFGGAYSVRTFSFVGPDGFIWSGRSAGDMDLARCKRTKQRHKGAV
jgi:hypothetical protein